ncbi:hypothetical protein PSACC_02411 [Paramicrosporidium saccamoebae]|uniref:Coatomer subunit zeta n=1 Tax=Paramicrosporidium saccamoebae TaxID=1246581 RepID=A0A2H9TJ40_9FUNG|nr:hypothetical protein PSACC_02411 [Paramicrosporidium saccamoebae]
MTRNSVSLYTVSAVIVLDTDGERLMAKYYPHDDLSASKKHEVVMCEGRVVVFRANLDLMVYVVGAAEQNELLLSCVLDTFFETLAESLKPQLDKRAFLEHYDTAALALDENRIILETDVHEVLGKIAKTPTSIVDMPLNEQTISSAFSFARQQLKSFLK